MHRHRLIFLSILLGTVAFSASAARAGRTVTTSAWFGGGFTKADYATQALAVGRAGADVVFLRHIGLGATFQGDREHWFIFATASLFLPALGPVEPYGRFHVGRREDAGDTALGWAGGLRAGPGPVKIFLEAHGVTEPGYGNGAALGLIF